MVDLLSTCLQRQEARGTGVEALQGPSAAAALHKVLAPHGRRISFLEFILATTARPEDDDGMRGRMEGRDGKRDR